MKTLRVATILCALWTSCALAQTPSQPMVPSGGGGGSPTGAAGGVLSGTYPNPGVANPFPAGVATATSIAIGGCTIGVQVFCTTGAGTMGNGTGAQIIDGVGVLLKFVNTEVARLPSSTEFRLTTPSSLSWNGDTFMSRFAAAVLQHGAADAAAPVAQTIKFQSVIAGTNNTAGVNATVIGSLSTGSGTSGDIIFQTGGTGAGATVQNSAVNALVLKGATQLVELPAIASDATHTDSSVCQDTTTHALYAGSGAAGICLGTSSIRFKPFVADLDVGLPQIMALQPISYKLDAAHGDPDKVLYGFTAEQGGTVLPQLMGRDAQGQPNTFDYLGVVPVLVKALQEQQAEIAELKRQIRGEAVPTLQ